MFSKIFLFACIATWAYAQHGYSDYGTHATSFFSSNVQSGHSSAPVVTKSSAPVISKFAVPAVAKIPATIYTKAPIHGDHYAPPKYEFHYEVEDYVTGDKKSQHEIRDGDVTKGQYSFVEADGTVRTVEYSVDGNSGFNAIVHRNGHASHSHTAPAKTVYAAPVKAVVSAPVIHEYIKH